MPNPTNAPPANSHRIRPVVRHCQMASKTARPIAAQVMSGRCRWPGNKRLATTSTGRRPTTPWPHLREAAPDLVDQHDRQQPGRPGSQPAGKMAGRQDPVKQRLPIEVRRRQGEQHLVRLVEHAGRIACGGKGNPRDAALDDRVAGDRVPLLVLPALLAVHERKAKQDKDRADPQ